MTQRVARTRAGAGVSAPISVAVARRFPASRCREDVQLATPGGDSQIRRPRALAKSEGMAAELWCGDD